MGSLEVLSLPSLKTLMKTIELTEQEQQALLQIIDLAVKAGGLQVAEASAAIAKKIAQPEPQQEEEEEG